jgi:hypothetical protein
MLIAAALLAPLAGCYSSLVARNMGNAYREDVNAQIADPEAARRNEPGPTGLDGKTGEDVMQRYHRAQGGARTPSVPMIVTTGGTR